MTRSLEACERITLLSVGCYEASGAISFVYEHDIEGGSEMNQYITGTAIKELREQRKMTQLQFLHCGGIFRSMSDGEAVPGGRS